MQKTGDREIAQELVQETFLVLFNNKDSAAKLSSLIAYLYVILKNKILDHHRRSLVEKRCQDFFSYVSTEQDNSTEAWIETRELERMLNEEIEKLPRQCRTVFKLSRQESKSNKEIASLLQISENTVEQHMRKALRILRTSLLENEKTLALLPLISLLEKDILKL